MKKRIKIDVVLRGNKADVKAKKEQFQAMTYSEEVVSFMSKEVGGINPGNFPSEKPVYEE